MNTGRLSIYFLQRHPKVSARILQQYEPGDIAAFFENIPPEAVANVIREMIPSAATECLESISFEHALKIITVLGTERAALLLRRMKAGQRVKFIRGMSTVFANLVRLILRYPEGTVGHSMNPNVFCVNDQMTVGEITNIFRKTGKQTFDKIFVTDDKHRLKGVVNTGQLITSDDIAIGKIMREPDAMVSARSSLHALKFNPEWNYNEYFPVIDHTGVLLGLINKRIVDETLSADSEFERQIDFSTTAFALAELFWDACADIISPELELKNRDRKHE